MATNKALDLFRKDGLWTPTKQEDGTFKISQTKLTNKQYTELKRTIQSLDADGYRSEERKKRDEENNRNGVIH